jgi:hypothetical protein
MEPEQLEKVLDKVVGSALVAALGHIQRADAAEKQRQRDWEDRRRKELWDREDELRGTEDKEEEAREERTWKHKVFIETLRWVGTLLLAWLVGGEAATMASEPLQHKMYQMEQTPSTIDEVAREHLKGKIEEAKTNGGVVEVTGDDLEAIREEAMRRLKEKAEKRFEKAISPDSHIKLDKANIEQRIQMPLPEGIRAEVKK